MSDAVAIVGVGIHPFGRHPGVSGLDMGVAAVRAALRDAGVAWRDIGVAAGGSDSAGNPDTMVSRLGLTGVPFINVRNGCATGGVALSVASSLLRTSGAELAVVVGFDKHDPGAFTEDPRDWGLDAWFGHTGMMVTTQFFGAKIQRYMYDHRISRDVLAMAAEKAFRNGAANPNAWRRRPLSREEILGSRMLADPLTQYMLCSPGEGAAALVLAKAERARQFGERAVWIRSCELASREFGSFEVFSPALSATRAPSPTVTAARLALERASIGAAEVDVVQLQDTDAGSEVIHLAECGFCQDGEQEELLSRGLVGIHGRLPVNTDGGCLANGEPIGASGLRQIHELVLQLRGEAGERQVPGRARVAFSHVYGAPGIAMCTVLSR